MVERRDRSQSRVRRSTPVTLETVRRLALALPLVEEGLSNGRPTFRIKGKLLAQLQQGGEALLIRTDYLKREILMNAEPDTFYVTDFYRCHPMMLIRLSGVRRDVLRGLLEEAWQQMAPKRLVKEGK